jgi:hypothetical protein
MSEQDKKQNEELSAEDLEQVAGGSGVTSSLAGKTLETQVETFHPTTLKPF